MVNQPEQNLYFFTNPKYIETRKELSEDGYKFREGRKGEQTTCIHVVHQLPHSMQKVLYYWPHLST